MIEGEMSISVATVRVLAIDERIRESAKSLPQLRYAVDLYRERKSLLAAAEEGRCDVAVIDLQLCGFSTARDLRELPEMSELAVVMFCDREQDRWLCVQGGADVVLVKPLQDTTTLVMAVESAMDSKK